jgi:hypothetical protein
MSGLRKEATLRGFNVIVVPEVATVIMNSGFMPDEDTATEFQKHILRVQYTFDRSFVKLARATHTPTLIIFDRGLMDGRAYTTQEKWDELLSKLIFFDDKGAKMDEEYILKSYDMVMHLVTAADGAERFYKYGYTTDDQGNSVYRGEPPEHARELDRKLKDVWSKHSHQVIVPNTDGGMKAKMQKVIEEVMAVCERCHPPTRERNTKELRSRARDLEEEIARLNKRVQQLEMQAKT